MAPRPEDLTAAVIVPAAPEEPWTPAVEAMHGGGLLPPDASYAANAAATDGQEVLSQDRPTVVLVDPLSTGVLLQQRVFSLGYRVILVWSDRSQPASRERHFERSGYTQQDFATIITHEAGELQDTLNKILAVTNNIVAVMCGSEHGVLLEDQIAEGLCQALGGVTHIKSSGMYSLQTKVDKHAQANTIRKAGLAAVREKLAKSEQDVQDFLDQFTESTEKCFVVKPQTGAGSVGVTFCDSEQAVWEAYHKILAGEHKAHCRAKYRHYEEAGVLLQEYLKGTEYIVNSVIRNGEIKTTAMFKYDKRPINGAAFVCFSKELMVLGDEPQLADILSYTENVLKAVGFQNGAIHAEIMYTARGPVLVELNCRLHGGNAAWVRPANLCMGYDQLSVFMDAYLNEGKSLFHIIPSRPERCRAYCQQVKMRSFVEGNLDYVIPEQWARIQALPSYLEHTFGVLPGEKISKTIDMPSVPGEITLVHDDKAVLAKDYEELNSILREGIFRVKEE